MGTLVVAALFQTLLGTLFSLFVGPRIEQSGSVIQHHRAVLIAAGLAVFSMAAAVTASLLVLRMRRR